MERVWTKTLEALKEKIGTNNVETWIKPVRPLALRDDAFHLEAPSALFRDWITGNLLGPLEESVSAIVGHAAHVVIHVNRKAQGDLFPEAAPCPPSPKPRLSGKTNLIPTYTFGTFVVGESNQFAHAAAKAVVSLPGERYNPLFIYGGVGLGKTHLVNAIGHELAQRRAAAARRVFYLSSEAFTNELIACLRRDKMDDFKNKFRQADVLIVDDIQFLSGRERTQEEFFHTFSTLHGTRKQIVLTSDKFPSQISDLEERLRNRFQSGLIADIRPPDLETRVAILQKKAERQALSLPRDVALFIAASIETNIRELEGALTRLSAFASMSGEAITINLARQVLHEFVKPRETSISIEAIQRAVSRRHGLRVADLSSKRRSQQIAIARQVAMYLSRKLCKASFPAIGHRFGGRDHTTVMHAVTATERRMREDEEFRQAVEELHSELVGKQRSAQPCQAQW
jgi:chromosomal replication initiator protein